MKFEIACLVKVRQRKCLNFDTSYSDNLYVEMRKLTFFIKKVKITKKSAFI